MAVDVFAPLPIAVGETQVGLEFTPQQDVAAAAELDAWLNAVYEE